MPNSNNLVTLGRLGTFLGEITNYFVKKEDGKGLSTNDLTDQLKAQYDAAQENVIEGIKVNGTAVEVTNKIADIAISTNLSDYNNDAGFLTETEVATLIDDAAYELPSDVVRTSDIVDVVRTADITDVVREDALEAVKEELEEAIGENTEAIEALSGRVTTLENAGYLTGTEVDTAIAEAILASDHLKHVIVDTLPSNSAAEDNIVYLILDENSTEEDTVYNMYMKLNGVVTKIGTTKCDLEGYLKEEDLTFATDDEIRALFANI